MSECDIEIEQIPFAMVSKFIFDYIKDANALKLYIGLFTWTDSKKYCYPTFKQIEERIGMSKNTITKSINKLKESGLLIVKEGEKNGNLKSNYVYFLKTTLPKKNKNEPIPKNGTRDSSIPKNGTDPIPKNGTDLSQELGYNDTQLIDNQLIDNQVKKAKPYSSSDRKKFFKNLKGKNQEQIQYLGKIMREFKEKNPNQYPDEFLKYFYETMIMEDEFGITKFEDSFSQKDQFGLPRRLNNWFKVWNSQKSSEMRGLSFAEQDRLRAKKNREEAENYDFTTMYLKKLAEEEEKERLKNLNTIDQAGMVLNAIR